VKGPFLYAIIDRGQCEAHGITTVEGLVALTEEVIAGGASVVQLRDEVSTAVEIFAAAVELSQVCRGRDVKFVVNDRLDIALATGADGVHLGPEDLPIRQARQVAGQELLIGASAGTVEAARQAVKDGADYLGVGAIFGGKASKPDASAPRGVEILREVRAAVEVPLVAIGGVDESNAAAAIGAGADGVAVIRGLLRSGEPAAAARGLCRAMGSLP
jgi:thiamine-phosphate pyrophosphorylase